MDRDKKASAALAELHSIESSDSPYANLHKIAGLISTVAAVNETQLKEKRDHVIKRVDEIIQQLQTEIDNSGIANSDLNNQLLRPMQLITSDIEKQTSIPEIYMLQTETAVECLDDGLMTQLGIEVFLKITEMDCAPLTVLMR